MTTAQQFLQDVLWFLTHVTPLAFLAAVVAVVAFGAARQAWWWWRDRRTEEAIATRYRNEEARASDH